MAPSWKTELTSPSVASCRRKTTTLMPSSPIETAPARIVIAPPVIVRGARTDLRPSATHSRALEPDRGVAHAVGADQPFAPLAADVRLAVGVPVAALLDRRGLGHVRTRSIVTLVMTTGSTGRSKPSVCVAPMVSTTALLSASVTSPKIVCLRLSQSVGTSGDEELRAVGAGAGVGHGQQVRPVEAQVGMELVVERVAGPAGARAQGVAALEHEVRDDTVERQTVVKRLP